MLRFFASAISQITAIAFAIYVGVFLFRFPEYSPPPDIAIRSAFVFCGVCAVYWWLQSGSLAFSDVKTTFGMASDIMTSFIPILVVGYALVDYWRGDLPLSPFKQYAAYFALGIVLLDVTFNTMIIFRLSRRYLRMG
jgi:hypothetical protein